MAPSTYTWLSDAQILLGSTPAVGVTGEVRRTTPGNPLTNFQPGNLDSSDLNYANLQALYLAAEAADRVGDTENGGWYTFGGGAGGAITKQAAGNVPVFDANGDLSAFVTTAQITSAAGYATAAAASATASASSATTSSTSATASSTSATLAQAWAANPEDVPVTSLLYSAFHWYRKTLALFNAVANTMAGWIHGATAKTTLVDADEMGLADSAASFGLAKVTMQGLRAYIANNSPLSGLRNKVINGNFYIAQRIASIAVTQTVSGYGLWDRWSNFHTGSTKVASVGSFVLGQTAVPGNPYYFQRTAVTSVAGAANQVGMYQAIEGVEHFSGKIATVTFWAKADIPRPMAVDLAQVFGTGGSPSATVVGIGARQLSLTASWQKFSFTVAVPSITGKTLGTALNDYLQLALWFDAGASLNARTASLGQQSGTFDIARVSMVEGDATAEDDPFAPRGRQQEMALCQRYYQTLGAITAAGYAGTGTNYCAYAPFKITMRGVPAVATKSFGAASNITSQTFLTANPDGVTMNLTVTSTGTGALQDIIVTADAEL